MRLFESKAVQYGAALVAVVLILATIGAANGALKLPGAGKNADASEGQAPPSSAASIELVPGEPHTLFIPEDVRAALGIRKGDLDQIVTTGKPTRTRDLAMPGTTMLDPTRLIPIRALFAPSPSSAQVVEIGTIEEDRLKTGSTVTTRRELRSGDKVTKGNLLAAFYSVDVGNKKK